MKMTNLLGLLAVTVLPLTSGHAQVPVTPAPGNPAPGTAAAAPTDLSAGASEVVRLAEAGTSDEVLQAYIQNASGPFGLTADQILYLRDIGVSQLAVTAMLNRDNALRNQPQTYNYNQTAYPPTVPPPAPLEPAPAPTVEAAPPPPPVAQPAPVYVSSPPPEVTYFYNDLSPYGTWVTLDGIGWCWQPRVLAINRGWRPYCDGGHWLNSDSGWFWQSDYSWGWAPFHYGRWQLHDRCGWVWLPDRVWGPSWVVWRSESDHCGWAPLPPHADFDVRLGWRFNGVRVGVNFDFGLRPDFFTFVAMKDFDRHDLGQRRLQQTEVTRIYNHTTVINNYVVNNNTVVNRGIEVDRVRAATHTPMRQLAVRDVPAGSPQMRGVSASRTELAVYRPELKAPARPVKMVAQRVDDRHPVIQHEPVATMNAPRRAAPAGNVYAPATGPRGMKSDFPANSPRPSNDRGVPPNPRSQTYSAPRDVQPAPAAPRFSEPPKAANHSPAPYAPTPAQRSETVAPRPAPEAQPARTPNISRPQEPAHLYPLRTGASSQQEYASPSQGAVYQPKTYHQAAEAHSLPPVQRPSRQDTSPSQPQNSHDNKSPKQRDQ
jgi:hypothetical protein